MAEYDIGLAEELAVVANSVERTPLEPFARERMRLYLALLSLELALKAMLERSGVPIRQIRGRSHGIKDLLTDLGGCFVEAEVTAGTLGRVPATRLRSVVISTPTERGTLGQLIDALDKGVSAYPTEIRYGADLKHFDAALVADAARQAVAFARVHWSSFSRA